jgi:hypothetical protein
MALEIHAIRFALTAFRSGADFRRTATIGRQNLHGVSLATLSDLCGKYGVPHTERLADCWKPDGTTFVEPFLHALGAEEVQSIDASSYEGASIIHDMNAPLPQALRNKFTTVIECGSLEHIFNFPTAIKNCMDLVAIGGHLLCLTPANNWLGHGFYQFSPELFYRLMNEPNGFSIEFLVLTEIHPGARWYQVADPAVVRRNVELRNSTPTFLMLRARKVKDMGSSLVIPQQAVYAAAWAKSTDPAHARFNDGPGPGNPRWLADRVFAIVPGRVRRAIAILGGENPFSDTVYTRIPYDG